MLEATVAYRAARGTTESVVHGVSGLLVGDHAEFTAAVGGLLDDREERLRLGRGALRVSHAFTWEHGQESFAQLVGATARRLPAPPDSTPTSATEDPSDDDAPGWDDGTSRGSRGSDPVSAA